MILYRHSSQQAALLFETLIAESWVSWCDA